MATDVGSNDQEKARLKDLLNAAHTLRNSLRGTSAKEEDLDRLIDLCGQCLSLSEQLAMEHGKGLALEMMMYAKMLKLDAKGPQVDPAQYEELEPQLLEAEKIASGFRDKNLMTRVEEVLANIYMRTKKYGKEVMAIEKAIAMSRTVPKVMALLECYQRIIRLIFEKDPSNTDEILRLHTDYWENYLWLKEQPEFNRDQFFKRSNVDLYKIAIYLANIAGNPLHVGENNPDNFKIAVEAYDEAIQVATVINNSELICAAHAHKAFMLAPRLNPDEKAQLVRMLKSLEDAYHPENTELHDTINLLINGSQEKSDMPSS